MIKYIIFFLIFSFSIIFANESLKVKKYPNLEFPQKAIEKLESGFVISKLYLDSLGEVDSFKILDVSDSIFLDNAKKYISNLGFQPIKDSNGVYLKSIVTYKINFDISNFIANRPPILMVKLIDDFTLLPLKNVFVKIALPHSYALKLARFNRKNFIKGDVLLAQTDSSGVAKFYMLPKSRLQISVLNPNYKNINDTINISSLQGTYKLKYRLEPDDDVDFVIEVFGKKRFSSGIKRSLTLEEISYVPGTGGDVLKVISFLPGVNRQKFDSYLGAPPVFRGTGSDDSRFFIDGVPLIRLFHLMGLRSAYNSVGIKELEVMPGAFNCRYGNSTAGVVNIKTKEPADTLSGYAQLSMIDAEFAIGQKIGNRWGYFISLRKSWYGDFMQIMSRLLKVKGSMIVSYYDINSKIFYNLNQYNKFTFELLHAKNIFGTVTMDPDYSNSMDSETDDNEFYYTNDFIVQYYNDHPETWTKLTKVYATHIFSTPILKWSYNKNNISNSLSLSYIPSSFDFYTNDSNIFNSNLHTYYLRNEFIYSANDKISNLFGFEMFNDNYKTDFGKFFNDLNLSSDTLNNDFEEIKDSVVNKTPFLYINLVANKAYYKYALYYMFNYNFSPKLLFSPGVRFDYYGNLSYNGSFIPIFYKNQNRYFEVNKPIEPSIRALIKYNFSDINKLSFSMGTYNKDYDILYAKNIEPQKALHFDLGYSHKTNKTQFSVDCYLQKMWNMQEYEFEIEHNIGDFVGVEDSGQTFSPRIVGIRLDGVGRSYGIEAMFKFNPSKRVYGWINYTLSRSERLDDNIWKIYEKDQTHSLKFVISYLTKSNYRFGTSLRFFSGDVVYPIQGAKYYDQKGYMDFFYYRDNEFDRLKPFLSLNFRIDRKIYFKNFASSWYIDISNINSLFYMSEEIGTVDYVVNNRGYVEKEVSSSGVQIPTISIGEKIEF